MPVSAPKAKPVQGTGASAVVATSPNQITTENSPNPSAIPRPSAPVTVSTPVRPSNPQQDQARKNLAQAAELHRAGKLDQAIQFYNLVLNDFPNSPNVLNDLGVALRASKRLHAAIACYRRALALGRAGGGTWSNLGNAYRDLRLYDDAVQCHQKAVEIDNESPSSVYNLGLALRDVGDLEKAHECFEKAVSADRDNPEYQWDRAITYLQQGDYRRGFDLYDWRLKLSRAVKRDLDKPLWAGEPLAGKTLFLYAEQGFGDMLQFARFVPVVAAMDCQLIVECHPTLLRLFATLGGDFQLVATGSATPPHDLVAPLLSVPGILRVDLDNLPAVTPYFRPPEIHNLRVAEPDDSRFKIGIIWAGKLTPRDRSCPLTHFIELISLPDVALFSLQLGDRTPDIEKFGVAGLMKDLAPMINDFADTAALMSQLDLIVTIDSAPSHLAGGLGVPVWTLLNYVADWRWLMDREDSPWYPRMSLFRQPVSEDWESVFVTVRQRLDAILENRRSDAAK